MSRISTPYLAPSRFVASPPTKYISRVSPKETRMLPAELPKSTFPWEANRPAPSRVFAEDTPRRMSIASSVTSTTDTITVDQRSGTATPATPGTPTTPQWSAYSMNNAWDEVPEIDRYVEKLQLHQRRRSFKSPGPLRAPGKEEEDDEITWRRQKQGNKLISFPTAAERPSLPVTPAPLLRQNFWGGDDNPLLPAAEAMPAPTEWVCSHGIQWSPEDCLCDLTNVLHYHKDPAAQLQKLARQQSEVLQKLGNSGRDSSDLPSRPLPYGSEDLVSPTFVARSANVMSSWSAKGLPPLEMPASRQGAKIAETTPTQIPKPSYAGPGAAFEKGENIPMEEAPMV